MFQNVKREFGFYNIGRICHIGTKFIFTSCDFIFNDLCLNTFKVIFDLRIILQTNRWGFFHIMGKHVKIHFAQSYISNNFHAKSISLSRSCNLNPWDTGTWITFIGRNFMMIEITQSFFTTTVKSRIKKVPVGFAPLRLHVIAGNSSNKLCQF